MSHTINVTDLTDQDAIHRILGEVQNHGVSYSLMQDGIEVAKVVPTEDKVVLMEDNGGRVPGELREKRLKVLERVDILAKRIAELWNTDETAAEVVANNRRF